MIDKNAFKKMRAQLEQYDRSREAVIRKSREVLKLSKAAIYSLHRNEVKDADKKLKSAKLGIKSLNTAIGKDIHLATTGIYREALEEYVEASCYASFLKDKSLPTPEQLGVDADVYLPGLCDLVGELVRKAINSSIEGDFKKAVQIKDFVKEVYEELMLFDFPNQPVRRKFDSIKYGLEKLENLTLELKLKNKIK